jgi:tetratricopeptide (TPR) repeat protein
MSASKIDHKELQRRLKEDELAHFFQEMRDNLNRIYQSYGRQVTLAIGLVAVIAIAIYFWSVKSDSDFLASQQYYSNAVAFIQKDQYPEALNELNSLLKILRLSSGDDGSRTARDCFAKNGDYEMALSDYKARCRNYQPWIRWSCALP